MNSGLLPECLSILRQRISVFMQYFVQNRTKTLLFMHLAYFQHVITLLFYLFLLQTTISTTETVLIMNCLRRKKPRFVRESKNKSTNKKEKTLLWMQCKCDQREILISIYIYTK